MNIAVLALILAGAIVLIWGWMVWPGLSQDWLPDELKAGKLVRVEEDLVTDEPYPVIGRPDQVYRLADGMHTPVELKTRAKHVVYSTDVAEISLRAWLLRRNNISTAGHGYVVINSTESGIRKAIRVELGDDAFCERLIARYIGLIAGDAAPRKSRGAKCNTCGHYSRCLRS